MGWGPGVFCFSVGAFSLVPHVLSRPCAGMTCVSRGPEPKTAFSLSLCLCLCLSKTTRIASFKGGVILIPWRWRLVAAHVSHRAAIHEIPIGNGWAVTSP